MATRLRPSFLIAYSAEMAPLLNMQNPRPRSGSAWCPAGWTSCGARRRGERSADGRRQSTTHGVAILDLAVHDRLEQPERGAEALQGEVVGAETKGRDAVAAVAARLVALALDAVDVLRSAQSVDQIRSCLPQ